jgi:hypothetical protein
MSKEQLIKCAEKYAVKYRTLIGNLEFDKKTAFKFYKNPDNFENLKGILKKDLIDNYRISEDKISENEFFKPFSYTLTNTYLDDTIQEETMEHSENGRESYLAIDDQEELFTIFPIAEEFNKSLKTVKGENTEIVDVWILLKPGGVSKRYLSFEKFLLDLKNELVEKIKIYEARLEARKQKIKPIQEDVIWKKQIMRTQVLDPTIEALTKKISDIQDTIKKIDYHLT